MQNEIEIALKNNVQVRDQLNECIEITNEYWEFLEQMLVEYNFETTKEKIFFLNM
jgi:hypothetical protein